VRCHILPELVTKPVATVILRDLRAVYCSRTRNIKGHTHESGFSFAAFQELLVRVSEVAQLGRFDKLDHTTTVVVDDNTRTRDGHTSVSTNHRHALRLAATLFHMDRSGKHFTACVAQLLGTHLRRAERRGGGGGHDVGLALATRPRQTAAANRSVQQQRRSHTPRRSQGRSVVSDMTSSTHTSADSAAAAAPMMAYQQSQEGRSRSAATIRRRTGDPSPLTFEREYAACLQNHPLPHTRHNNKHHKQQRPLQQTPVEHSVVGDVHIGDPRRQGHSTRARSVDTTTTATTTPAHRDRGRSGKQRVAAAAATARHTGMITPAASLAASADQLKLKRFQQQRRSRVLISDARNVVGCRTSPAKKDWGWSGPRPQGWRQVLGGDIVIADVPARNRREAKTGTTEYLSATAPLNPRASARVRFADDATRRRGRVGVRRGSSYSVAATDVAEVDDNDDCSYDRDDHVPTKLEPRRVSGRRRSLRQPQHGRHQQVNTQHLRSQQARHDEQAQDNTRRHTTHNRRARTSSLPSAVGTHDDSSSSNINMWRSRECSLSTASTMVSTQPLEQHTNQTNREVGPCLATQWAVGPMVIDELGDRSGGEAVHYRNCTTRIRSRGDDAASTALSALSAARTVQTTTESSAEARSAHSVGAATTTQPAEQECAADAFVREEKARLAELTLSNSLLNRLTGPNGQVAASVLTSSGAAHVRVGDVALDTDTSTMFRSGVRLSARQVLQCQTARGLCTTSVTARGDCGAGVVGLQQELNVASGRVQGRAEVAGVARRSAANGPDNWRVVGDEVMRKLSSAVAGTTKY
jgi:hypothetical protein